MHHLPQQIKTRGVTDNEHAPSPITPDYGPPMATAMEESIGATGSPAYGENKKNRLGIAGADDKRTEA